jgi:hypothetical protein
MTSRLKITESNIFPESSIMESMQYPERVMYQPVTITSGQTESAPVRLFGTTLVALSMPSAFTGASVTIKGSIDGTTFNTIYKDGADFAISVAANKIVVLQPADMAAVNWIRVTAASAQAADRTINLVLRAL